MYCREKLSLPEGRPSTANHRARPRVQVDLTGKAYMMRQNATMSPSENPSSGQASGLPASTPDAVLAELRRQAERKAALKMFYTAADVFRDYRGSFTRETATERERLAAEYDQRGRAAEEARWGSGCNAAAAIPPRPPPPPPPPAPVRPPTPSTLSQRPRPKAETTQPTRATADKSARPVTPSVQLQGGQLTFACRWCKESISVDASLAGKLVPCPKCDLLVSVPKI